MRERVDGWGKPEECPARGQEPERQEKRRDTGQGLVDGVLGKIGGPRSEKIPGQPGSGPPGAWREPTVQSSQRRPRRRLWADGAAGPVRPLGQVEPFVQAICSSHLQEGARALKGDSGLCLRLPRPALSWHCSPNLDAKTEGRAWDQLGGGCAWARS